MTFRYFLLLFVILSSCSVNKKNNTSINAKPAKKVDERKTNNTTLEGTSWIFINFLPTNGEIKSNTNKPTLKFGKIDNNIIQFNGRCFVNSYGGTMTVKGTDLIASADIYSTEMASMNVLQNQREKEYLKNLNKVISYNLRNDTLTLFTTNSEGENLNKALLFARANQ